MAFGSYSVWIVRVRTLSQSPKKTQVAVAMVSAMDLLMCHTTTPRLCLLQLCLVLVDAGKQIGCLDMCSLMRVSSTQEYQWVSVRHPFPIETVLAY
jgi:hypothetical protein